MQLIGGFYKNENKLAGENRSDSFTVENYQRERRQTGQRVALCLPTSLCDIR